MVWDPAIPATNADLLSAPVRDNFAALETSVMGALGALATQQVLIRTTGPAIGGVATGANGQVLTLASGVPVWQAAPTGGGAVGEWRWSTTTTSPAASQQMRLNGAHPYTTATTLWVSYLTTAGTDARIALLLTKPGQTLHIQDKNDSSLYVRLTVTAAPTDDAANGQVVLPVAWVSNGNALLNNQNVLMVVGAAQSAATIIDAKGDLIVGTAADTATRLGIGTDTQVLTADSAQATGMKWAAAPGLTNPMTAVGDVIRGGTAGAPTRLAIGATNQVLTVVGGVPAWTTPFTNPMTTAQDLIVGGASGAATRLAVGSNTQVLTVTAGVVGWAAAPGGLTNPMTNIGDLIRGGTSGVPTRLAAVATGAVLASAGVNTAPTWNTSPSLTGLTLSGLTQGSVLFAGAGGAITQDNANLFYDNTNDNLRLGASAVGTSGQKVLALGPGTAPTTSPVDTVQLTTVDLFGEAGSRGLHIRDERGGTFETGSDATSGMGVYVRTTGTPIGAYLYADGVGGHVGTETVHGLYLETAGASRMYLGTDHHVTLSVGGVAPRLLGTGAADSGGAGWRTLLIAN